MSSIYSLLQALPTISQSRMIGSGYALWMVWNGQLNNSVVVTLKDYGLVPMAQESNQALWFCPTTDIFRALARLLVYARLHPTPAFCQVMPVTFQAGYDLKPSLSLAAEFTKQAVEAKGEFEVWVHPKLMEDVKRIAGLELRDRSSIAGLSNAGWMMFVADEGLNYETALSWYCAIKPVGRMKEKEAIMSWRAYLEEIKEILTKHKLQYIIGTREEMVLLPLRNLRELRDFCTDFLELCRDAKEDDDRHYWPSVIAAVPQKNLQFAEEVANKFNVDWNKLIPDQPHLHYRDAYMLSEWFQINEARYGGEESLESWCNISLKDGGGLIAKAAADVPLPRSLVIGSEEQECFYCGLHNHTPQDCPSKGYDKLHPGLWNVLAKVSVQDLPDAIRKLDAELSSNGDVEIIGDMLVSGKGLERQLLRAVFEINSCCQLRMLRRVWQARGKEWPDGLEQYAEGDGLFAEDSLRLIQEKEYEQAIVELKRIRATHPRSFIPSSLQGFLYLESGDPNQAVFYWQEAERLSLTPLLQGYFVFLQARLLEVTGELKEAATLYRRAYTISPNWHDTLYRSAVCMVKMGFTGQAVDILTEILEHNPHFFNRVLIDPELDRGRSHVLSAMWERWGIAEAQVKELREEVESLQSEIALRFEEDHEFFEPAQTQLGRMERLGKRNNYVAFHDLISMVSIFKNKLGKQVDRDVKRMQKKTEFLVERLKEIQKEAAWFPFPKLLREFNNDFNFCVEKMNWIMHQHIKSAEKFRQARRDLIEIEDRLKTLQGRLVTLRIVRDSTLFALMLGRAFIWLEVIGLGLALVGIPAIIYFTKGVENIWILDMIREKEWEFQKGLILILSACALVLAALKSALTFEKRKRELFERSNT